MVDSGKAAYSVRRVFLFRLLVLLVPLVLATLAGAYVVTVLASGLEVLQALYNNQLQTLNNRMTMTITWLTILGTAVLVPTTIATVVGSLGGMDSNMLFWYGAVLVLATVNSTYLAYWWVNRWVHLPKGG